MPSISVRAIIIQHNALLLLRRNRSGVLPFYVTPGGRVEKGEKYIPALKRECLEELGVHVKVGRHLATFIARYPDGNREQRYFRCSITSGKVGTGTGPEHQQGGGYAGSYTPEWIPKNKVATLPFRPKKVLQMLAGQFSNPSCFREKPTAVRKHHIRGTS